MEPLRDLAEQLGTDDYCRYTKEGGYPLYQDGRFQRWLKSAELLEVGLRVPSRQQTMIATFDDQPTRILYFADDINVARRTMKELRLPHSWSTNLGEKVFYCFREELSHGLDAVNSDPVAMETIVVPGKEGQFKQVLRKLMTIYRITEENAQAAALNMALSGEASNLDWY